MSETKKELDGKKTATEETQEEALKAQAAQDSKKAVLEAIKQTALKGLQMTPEEEKAALEMLDEAAMPVVFTDNDLKLGPQEIDIRKLSTRNFHQMLFRTMIVQGVWLRNISKSMLDIVNLFFVLLDKIGVENIVKVSDQILLKIHKEQLESQKAGLEAKLAQPEEENKQPEDKAN